MAELETAADWLMRALERDLSDESEAAEAREDIKTALMLINSAYNPEDGA